MKMAEATTGRWVIRYGCQLCSAIRNANEGGRHGNSLGIGPGLEEVLMIAYSEPKLKDGQHETSAPSANVPQTSLSPECQSPLVRSSPSTAPIDLEQGTHDPSRLCPTTLWRKRLACARCNATVQHGIPHAYERCKFCTYMMGRQGYHPEG